MVKNDENERKKITANTIHQQNDKMYMHNK